MERYRPYEGRRHSVHRRRTGAGSSSYHPESTSKRTIKLAVCVGLFVVAALIKLLFPSTFALVGEKINAVVNYKAALTTLGEGFSGEKKFTTALSEAFTYAFTGAEPAAETSATTGDKTDTANGQDAEKTSGSAAGSAAPAEVVVVTPGDDKTAAASAQDSSGKADEDSVAAFAESGSDVKDGPASFSDAVIAAFKESQEDYSDYAVPAGVTYEMPAVNFAHTAPVIGTVSSSFGFRVHPTKDSVLFHYGMDIAAPKGTAVNAFADGKVIAAGESASLGKYVLISHGNVESQYGHCSNIYVESGQTVKMGERIASVGKTGNATETCLHFELKVNGEYVNPAYYIGEWQ